jgi:uncharacterized protein YlaI
MNFNMDINVRFCCLYGRIFYLYTWKAKGCTQFLHLQLCANCKKVVKAENKSDTNSQHFFFTPLETHGMEKITAWRRREISFAMQKKREYYHLIGLSQ